MIQSVCQTHSVQMPFDLFLAGSPCLTHRSIQQMFSLSPEDASFFLAAQGLKGSSGVNVVAEKQQQVILVCVVL